MEQNRRTPKPKKTEIVIRVLSPEFTDRHQASSQQRLLVDNFNLSYRKNQIALVMDRIKRQLRELISDNASETEHILQQFANIAAQMRPADSRQFTFAEVSNEFKSKASVDRESQTEETVPLFYQQISIIKDAFTASPQQTKDRQYAKAREALHKQTTQENLNLTRQNLRLIEENIQLNQTIQTLNQKLSQTLKKNQELERTVQIKQEAGSACGSKIQFTSANNGQSSREQIMMELVQVFSPRSSVSSKRKSEFQTAKGLTSSHFLSILQTSSKPLQSSTRMCSQRKNVHVQTEDILNPKREQNYQKIANNLSKQITKKGQLIKHVQGLLGQMIGYGISLTHSNAEHYIEEAIQQKSNKQSKFKRKSTLMSDIKDKPSRMQHCKSPTLRASMPEQPIPFKYIPTRW